jgi:hypothetical protein
MSHVVLTFIGEPRNISSLYSSEIEEYKIF